MAKDIKVKKEKKGDIKQLNRNVVGIQKVKNEIVKSRNEISEITNKNENVNSSNEVEYATNKISNNIKTASAIGIDKYNEYGKKSVVETKNNIVKVKDNIDLIKIRYAQNKMIKQKEMKKYSIRNTEFENEEIENTRIELKKDSIKLAENIKQVNKEDEVISLKTNSKNNIKIKNNVIENAPKSKNENFIKTMQNTKTQIIKTSSNTENVIGNTSAQKIATQINKMKDKIIKNSREIKKIFQKLFAGLKALAKGSKALMIALFAGGWVLGLIIIVIMLVGLFCSSSFGILFANEGVDGGKPLKQVIREINTEFSTKIKDIQNSVTHDDYTINSKRAKIKDVIAVYAVKVSGSDDDGQEVITMTPEKEEKFKKIFWDMNKIDYTTETQTESHIEKDKKGKDKVVTTSKTILHISVTSKTAYEMADQYHFNRKQRQQLEELLSDKYANLLKSLLYGSSGGNTAIVEVAESQIGNVGGQPYWSWYGFTSRVSWCACFVSWCANECGYIDSGVIPKFAACQDQGISWFQACGLWQDGSYMANPGDIIFFDWEHDGHSDHVGIVEYVEDGVVHTIEGNTNDSCARREYSADSLDICGYGTPMYE